MFLFKELQFFLRETKLKRVKLNNKVFISSLKKFIIFDLVVVITAGLLMTIAFIFFDAFKELLISKTNFSDISLIKSVFYFCIISPLIEELTFRIGLKISRLNIAIYLGFNLLAILQISEIYEQTLIIKFFLAAFLSLLFFLFLKGNHLSIFKNNYRLFLYFNIFYFALVHLGNYSFSHSSQYLFVPLLIFVQIFLGIYLSYSRLKFGFFFALFIHFFHNFSYTILQNLL